MLSNLYTHKEKNPYCSTLIYRFPDFAWTLADTMVVCTYIQTCNVMKYASMISTFSITIATCYCDWKQKVWLIRPPPAAPRPEPPATLEPCRQRPQEDNWNLQTRFSVYFYAVNYYCSLLELLLLRSRLSYLIVLLV